MRTILILMAGAASVWGQASVEAQAEQARRAQAGMTQQMMQQRPQTDPVQPVQPQADRWLKYGDNVYIDSKTVEYSDDCRSMKLWFKTVFSNGVYELKRIEIADRRVRELAHRLYSTSGALLGSQPATDWEEIAPGSDMEELYQGLLVEAQQRLRALQASQAAQQAAQQRAYQADMERRRRFRMLNCIGGNMQGYLNLGEALANASWRCQQ